MSVLTFFKSFAAPSQESAQTTRCYHHYPNGSRCQLSIDASSDLFCGRHVKNGRLSKTARTLLAGMDGASEADLAAVTAEMYGPVKSLDSAVAINHVFGNLFRLTLEGRIPQRQAAQLTTQLRSMLKSLDAAKAEITNAKCFPGSNPEVLVLLDALSTPQPASATNRENVAPHSSAVSIVPAETIEPPPSPATPQPGAPRPTPSAPQPDAPFSARRACPPWRGRAASDGRKWALEDRREETRSAERSHPLSLPSNANDNSNDPAAPSRSTQNARRSTNSTPPPTNHTYAEALAASLLNNKDGLTPEDLNPGIPPDLRNQRHDGRPLSFNRRSVGPDGRGRGRWFGR